jgi:two-component system OmpR family response regulator
MARNQYLSQHSGGAKLRYEMAMDLQQRPPEYGHWRHHTRHETEPVPDGRVVLVSNSPTNGGITKAPAFSPDLLLLDVMMPTMDGPELLQELRKLPQFTQTPVIFMTAKAQPEEVQQFMELGAIDVITKPFDPMTLADQIRAIWQNTR